MSTAGPRYRADDLLEETARPGRRLLVVAVGEEAYLVRRLDPLAPGQAGLEPRESAWAHAGCEAATLLVGRRDERSPWVGD
ncbi:hypothetical protein ACFWA9_04365 [Kitasatospora sp. NPDC059973]|uniref:hypothetical protein n=1 Tax=Kitasatospora sp. NPDC059973 TaxID=3347020 RepID=UPI00367B3FD5